MVHVLRDEGRQQAKEITRVVEASHLMTRKELKCVFERVDSIEAGISTGNNQQKTLMERLDGIECAILRLVESAEAPCKYSFSCPSFDQTSEAILVPQPTRPEIAESRKCHQIAGE